MYVFQTLLALIWYAPKIKNAIQKFASFQDQVVLETRSSATLLNLAGKSHEKSIAPLFAKGPLAVA